MVRVKDLKFVRVLIEPGSTVTVEWTRSQFSDHEQTFPLERLVAALPGSRPADGADIDPDAFADRMWTLGEWLATARHDAPEHGRTAGPERSVSDWRIYAPGTVPATADGPGAQAPADTTDPATAAVRRARDVVHAWRAYVQGFEDEHGDRREIWEAGTYDRFDAERNDHGYGAMPALEALTDADFITPYQPGQPLTLVFTEGRYSPSANPVVECEYLFRLLNIGHDPDFGPPDPEAVAYRQRGNRSLSVGDVVALTPDGAPTYFYAVAGVGFRLLTEPPTLASHAQHGTAPLG